MSIGMIILLVIISVIVIAFLPFIIFFTIEMGSVIANGWGFLFELIKDASEKKREGKKKK